jgi:hypothetical protein
MQLEGTDKCLKSIHATKPIVVIMPDFMALNGMLRAHSTTNLTAMMGLGIGMLAEPVPVLTGNLRAHIGIPAGWLTDKS